MDEKYLKVEGGNFVKDKTNRAILAVNKNILLQNEARKKIKNKIMSNDEQINKLKDQVENITDDITEIKSMLQLLIKNKG